MRERIKGEKGRYALAVLITVPAVLLRWLVDPLVGDTGQFLTFYFSVMLATAFGGIGPGLLATVLGGAAGIGLFIWLGHAGPGWADDITRLLLFLMFGGVTLLLAWQVGVRNRALSRAGELEAVRNRLAAELAAMSQLHEISTYLVRQGDMRSLLDEIIQAAVRIGKADKGNIQLRDEQGVLRIVAHVGFDRAFVAVFSNVLAGQAACGAAMARQQRVIVEDITCSPMFLGTKWLDTLLAAGVRAIQCTPMVSRSGRLLGILSTHYRTACRPAEEDLQVLDLLARQAADHIERMQYEESLREINEHLEERVAERTAVAERRAGQLRRIAAELAQSEQRERKRIAQVLHDHLQQVLVGARYHIRIAEQASGHGAVASAVQRVDELLCDALAVTRSLTVELSPSILYTGSFREAMEWLGRWMHDKHGLEVHVDADPTINPPSEEVRVLLFQVAKELLFNVAKHARVDKAVVQLRLVGPDEVCLAVADDGAGFDPAERFQAKEGGFGLVSIRERVELLGGQLAVDSAAGSGTRVKVVVPVAATP